LEGVSEVLSHPQALAQCSQWLAQHLGSALQLPTSSTAEAARLVKGSRFRAAIASREAARDHGLEVLAYPINDVPGNCTRFLLLQRSAREETGPLASLAFSLRSNQPGALLQSLVCFAAHGLKATLDPEMLAIWETGARYQLIHALALLGLLASFAIAQESPSGTPSPSATGTRSASGTPPEVVGGTKSARFGSKTCRFGSWLLRSFWSPELSAPRPPMVFACSPAQRVFKLPLARSVALWRLHASQLSAGATATHGVRTGSTATAAPPPAAPPPPPPPPLAPPPAAAALLSFFANRMIGGSDFE
jgi:hypothetical protein